jgi:hypothetical protein
MISSPLNKQTVDRFLLVLDIPPGLRHLKTNNVRTNNLINLNSMQFTVFGSVVPNIEVNYSVERFHGQSFAISKHSKTPPSPITIRFQIDNNFNNYWFIYKWLDYISDEREGLYDAKNQQRIMKDLPGIPYQTNLSIFALDEYQQAKTIRFDYTYAFPVSLAGFDWSYKEDNIITSSFSFMYSQFKAELLCNADDDSVTTPEETNPLENC